MESRLDHIVNLLDYAIAECENADDKAAIDEAKRAVVSAQMKIAERKTAAEEARENGGLPSGLALDSSGGLI